jgi:hypothetical protein
VFTWTPSATGSFIFKVRVTDNSTLALFDEETITVTVTASFAGNEPGNEMKIAELANASIYPNPVTNRLIVTLNTPMERIETIITDVKGLVLKRSEHQLYGGKSFELNVAQLNPGAYFLRLQTKDGEKIFSFIKQE